MWGCGLVVLTGPAVFSTQDPTLTWKRIWSGFPWGTLIPLQRAIVPLPCPSGTFPFTSAGLTWGTHCSKTFSSWLKEFSVEQTQVCWEWYLENLLLVDVLAFAFWAQVRPYLLNKALFAWWEELALATELGSLWMGHTLKILEGGKFQPVGCLTSDLKIKISELHHKSSEASSTFFFNSACF